MPSYGVIGDNTFRWIAYLRRCIFGILRLPVPHIFRFRPEDLDNEEVILAIENTPTYKRTSQQVKELQSRVTDKREQVKQQPEEEVVRTIKF